MKLTFGSKQMIYHTDGSMINTRVTLTNADGAIYPVFLEPDAINKTNSQLEVLALDIIYQENFPDKYKKDVSDTNAQEHSKFKSDIDELKNSVNINKTSIDGIDTAVNVITSDIEKLVKALLNKQVLNASDVENITYRESDDIAT